MRMCVQIVCMEPFVQKVLLDWLRLRALFQRIYFKWFSDSYRRKLKWENFLFVLKLNAPPENHIPWKRPTLHYFDIWKITPLLFG